MAETVAVLFSNICPFCNKKLNSQFLLGKHLLAVHNICVNTNLNRNQDEDWQKERMHFNATEAGKPSEGKSDDSCIYCFNGACGLADCNSLTLGNKLKTLKFVLRENFGKYIETLKDWINCKISRIEFDESIRPLFYNDTTVIHNEFLICFLKEIRSINQSSINIIREKSNFASHVVLLPVDEPPAEEVTESPLFELNKMIAENVKSTTIQKTLPDEETMYALTIVHAWENGCSSVNKKVVPVLSSTAENILKIVRDAVMKRRRSLKVRPDGSVYDATQVDPNEVSTEDKSKYTGNIDAAEIIDALKVEKSLLPFKSLSKVLSEVMKFDANREAEKEKDMEL